MIVLCIVFVYLLDYFVLRRIVNLSNALKTQTESDVDALKDEDSSTATSVAQGKKENAQDDEYAQKRGKLGKSSSSRTSKGTQSTESSYDLAQMHGHDHEQIEELRRDMEQKALALRKRLECLDDDVKIEHQKIIRQRQALQLLNLWCVRKDYFPGLRHYEQQFSFDSMSLEELLSNPLSVEFLKSQ